MRVELTCEPCVHECVKGLEKPTPDGTAKSASSARLSAAALNASCRNVPFPPVPQTMGREGTNAETLTASQGCPLCSSPTTDNQWESNPSFYLKLSWL